ncbi:SDR family oxidoreductase [Acanthopleuribacter pedis]|uniref:SDR family oxidoreductase n=1 Tax=Acanthopleuribacter pedis TaxID=442870 RepID=A0A8J7QG64_9BACT|nr:SDR family oxidoreductase [Acanthopleuribacter pedis]MBO1318008.1 SDR family oxidoreductase [Acanthopleuribacter pedis]
MPAPPPTVIIGAKGFIGSALWQAYHQRSPLHRGTTRTGDGDALLAYDLVQTPPDHLDQLGDTVREAVLMAAISRVNVCENDPEGSHRVNVTGIERCVRWLWQRGIRPIFISTDYVFDGRKGNYREDDPTHPITAYGRQKRAAEEAVLAITGGAATVLRLSKIYAAVAGDGSLLDEMVATLARGQSIRAAVDQIFCPLYIGDLISVIQTLQTSGVTGIVHVCGDQPISRHQLAQQVTARFGADPGLVEPISLDDLQAGPVRPKNTSMCNTFLRRFYHAPFTPATTIVDQLAATYRAHS